MSLRTISKIVSANSIPEGFGASVLRSIGGRSPLRDLNPFLLFDHFIATNNKGFPEHPHKGQETITYVLNGRIAHEDFTGSKGVLYKGDLQFMTAGKGIVHLEMPMENEDLTPTIGLQLWVDLPKHLRGTEPRYRDLKTWEIPQVVDQDGKVKIRVISGKYNDVNSVKDLAYTPIHFYHGTLQPGSHFRINTPRDFNFFTYIINGTLSGLTPSSDKSAGRLQNIIYNNDGDYVEGVNNSDGEVEFVTVGGQILDQTYKKYGPFIGDTKAEVETAFDDYEAGVNGFERVLNWKSTISEGVETGDLKALGGSLAEREIERLEYLKMKKT
ncbi:uncharacterized protein KQ657_002536 [Scheffersomyces spartinae]|uniref:Pirin n=1 Tax=Scheffersomyces spartinae TaxID=45513 RepID=A0A9P7V6B2_9ASCO|nr:uncharacterized protein KQ657_002536 [Scheffersomyces spartinae]KAG7192169.1 hypothetical protein KQ657_002536 [Scheffersomyces spartinae]